MNVKNDTLVRGVVQIIKKDGNKGAGFPLHMGETVFGRDKDADVRIKINSISRKHMKIIVDENSNMKLIHLSGTNPTLVNCRVVQNSIDLKDGDQISMGETTFLLKQARISKPKLGNNSFILLLKPTFKFKN